MCPHDTISISVNDNGSLSYSGDSAYGLNVVKTAVDGNSPRAGSMIAMYDGTPGTDQSARLTVHPMGIVIFSIIGNSTGHPPSSLSIPQLKQYFTLHGVPGWVAVGRQKGSGTRKAFLGVLGYTEPALKLLGPACPAATGHAASAGVCYETSTTNVINYVANTPNAIGYAQTAVGSGSSDLTPIEIGGYAAKAANVLDKKYHFWTGETFWTAPRPSALATDFIKFLMQYPSSDYIACSKAQQLLNTSCVS
jgi:phosphate transport system substrate-binding protein